MNRSRIIAFALGPVAAAIFGLVTIPIVAWIFDAEDVGRLKVYQIAVSFSLLICVLGLDQAYVREYHETSDKEALLKLCFLPGFALLMFLALIAGSFSNELTELIYGVNQTGLFAVTLASIVLSFISRFFALILRMEGRGLAYSMSQALPKALQVALIIGMAGIAFERSFLHLLVASFLSLLFVFVICAWNTRLQWRPALTKSVDGVELRKVLRFGSPLILSSLTYWGLSTTSFLALRSWSSLPELAVYSVATSFAGAALIFQAIFSVVWAPTVYKWAADGVDMSKVDRMSQKVLAVICAIITACGTFSWLVDYVLPAGYGEVKYILTCCMVQPLLYTLSEVTCVGIGICRRSMLTVWVTIVAAFTNLALCFALIPPYGVAGAATANAVAFFVFFVARTEFSAWVWRSFPRQKTYFFVSTIVVLSVATVMSAPLPFPPGLCWAILMPGAYVAFQEEWREILQFLRGDSHHVQHSA